MRWLRVIIGVVLVLVGVLWIGQGLNLIAGSVMTGQAVYAVLGLAVAALGAWLILGFRGSETTTPSRAPGLSRAHVWWDHDARPTRCCRPSSVFALTARMWLTHRSEEALTPTRTLEELHQVALGSFSVAMRIRR